MRAMAGLLLVAIQRAQLLACFLHGWAQNIQARSLGAFSGSE